jgi:hypothetical protein
VAGKTEVKQLGTGNKDPDSPGQLEERPLFAEIGAGALVGIGVFIGKLLFDRGAPAAPQPIVIHNPSRGHSRLGYRHRKKNNDRS